MSLSKKPLKSRPVCKVTFSLPSDMVNGAQSIALAGEFNGWSLDTHPLKRKRDGTYAITVDLEPDHRYQFRYVIDGERWENDDSADAYVPNELGTENSVIHT